MLVEILEPTLFIVISLLLRVIDSKSLYSLHKIYGAILLFYEIQNVTQVIINYWIYALDEIRF